MQNIGLARANNIRLLTNDELTFINKKFRCRIENEELVVEYSTRMGQCRHSIFESFSINVRGMRKLTITSFAMLMYDEFCRNNKIDNYTIFDVQNAINILRVSYQSVNKTNVLYVLRKGNEQNEKD